MKKYFFLYPALAVCLNSCLDEPINPSDVDCPEIACTTDFRSITVKVEKAEGDTINLKELNSKNLRTGKEIDNSNYKDLGVVTRSSVVITDAETKNLSEKGDTILVTAISKSNQTKTARFVVSGGKCACHIAKVSGPEKIVF